MTMKNSLVVLCCHNFCPSSPRRDFKRYDIMGAIIVRLSR